MIQARKTTPQTLRIEPHKTNKMLVLESLLKSERVTELDFKNGYFVTRTAQQIYELRSRENLLIDKINQQSKNPRKTTPYALWKLPKNETNFERAKAIATLLRYERLLIECKEIEALKEVREKLKIIRSDFGLHYKGYKLTKGTIKAIEEARFRVDNPSEWGELGSPLFGVYQTAKKVCDLMQ